MFKRKIICILLILALLFSVIPSVSAEDAGYKITTKTIDLNILNNGLIHVLEQEYCYIHSGEDYSNEITLIIPKSKNEQIKNLDITLSKYYFNKKIVNTANATTIKLYLYKNKQKTEKLDEDVGSFIVLKYDRVNKINLYNDIAELNYPVFSKGEPAISNIIMNIKFPSNINSNNIDYWAKPYYPSSNSYLKGNTLHISNEDIWKNDHFTVRAIFPHNSINTPTYANIINKNGLNKIKSDEQNILDDYESNYNISIGLIILATISLIIPVIIYIKYGREPKINYKGIYEREPPSHEPPLLINTVFHETSRKPGASPDLYGLEAVILDLIRRKYISIEKVNNDTNLIVNPNTNDLEEYEEGAIELLKLFEIDGKISINYIKKQLKDDIEASWFKIQFIKWSNKFIETYKDSINSYIDERGFRYAIIYIIFLFILGFAITFIPSFLLTGMNHPSILIGLIFIGIGTGLALTKTSVFGSWTEEGAIQNAKWKNFRKFIDEYTLIGESPIEDLDKWGDYYIYATAMGKNILIPTIIPSDKLGAYM